MSDIINAAINQVKSNGKITIDASKPEAININQKDDSIEMMVCEDIPVDICHNTKCEVCLVNKISYPTNNINNEME